MKRLRIFLFRLLALVHSQRADRDLNDEIDGHLAEAMDEYIERGLSPADARLAALRSFGGVVQTKEAHRDTRSFVWIGDVEQDLQYAIRTLRKSPAFSIVAVLTLALGVGANTAIFSVVNALLLRPLPFKDSDRLVRIFENSSPSTGASGGPRRTPAALDVDELAELASRTRTLSYVGAYPRTAMWLNGSRETTQLLGTRVSAVVFSMLGAQPFMGRLFEPREESAGASPVIILSYVTWQRYLGGSSDVLSQTLLLDGTSFSIIGVMPQGFEFPDPQTQFWIPFGASTLPPGVFQKVAPIARLKDGVSVKAATAEVSTILDQFRGSLPPDTPSDAAGPPSFEVVRVQDDLVAPVRPALIVLAGSVAFVLLIACANVANLLLARSTARRQEIAVRLALGASRGRLIRQFLTESVLLAVIGGTVGTALAAGGIRVFRTLATVLPRRDLGLGATIPRLDEIHIDAAVLLFTLAISVLTGLAFGLAPAIGASHHGTKGLREGTASPPSGLNLFRRGRTQGVLVIAEIGTAMMLLIGAGLLVYSFVKLSTVDPGYDPTNVLTFQVPRGRYAPSELNAFADALVVRLQALPGVHAAGYAHDLPMIPGVPGMPLRTARGASEPPTKGIESRTVSRDFLATMAIRVIAGRGFTDDDRAGRPLVMLVNQKLATTLFPGENAIGKLVYSMGDVSFEIVGVVKDVRQVGLDQEPGPQSFVDSRQGPGLPNPLGLGPYFAVRTEGDPAVVAANIRAIVEQIDPRVRVENVATMEQILTNSINRPRLYAVLLGIFAAIAAVLSCIGIYGVISYSVAQRTREIGIRMALGAKRSYVMRLVLGQSLPLIGIGLLLGLLGAAAVTQYLQGMLFSLTPLDPSTFAVVSLTFALVATLSTCLPARRAMNVDPLVALRCE